MPWLFLKFFFVTFPNPLYLVCNAFRSCHFQVSPLTFSLTKRLCFWGFCSQAYDSIFNLLSSFHRMKPHTELCSFCLCQNKLAFQLEFIVIQFLSLYLIPQSFSCYCVTHSNDLPQLTLLLSLSSYYYSPPCNFPLLFLYPPSPLLHINTWQWF